VEWRSSLGRLAMHVDRRKRVRIGLRLRGDLRVQWRPLLLLLYARVGQQTDILRHARPSAEKPGRSGRRARRAEPNRSIAHCRPQSRALNSPTLTIRSTTRLSSSGGNLAIVVMASSPLELANRIQDAAAFPSATCILTNRRSPRAAPSRPHWTPQRGDPAPEFETGNAEQNKLYARLLQAEFMQIKEDLASGAVTVNRVLEAWTTEFEETYEKKRSQSLGLGRQVQAAGVQAPTESQANVIPPPKSSPLWISSRSQILSITLSSYQVISIRLRKRCPI
jgi:hypothetical protein